MRVGANQKQLAGILGVSQSTISRALAGSTRVSAVLTGRVRALCDELGYVPDFSGSSLSSGKTRNLSAVLRSEGGILVSDVHSHWVGQLSHAALERGYRLRVDTLASLGRTISERSADGIVVFGMSGQAGSRIPQDGCPLPAVFTDCISNLATGVVSIDNAGGTANAVAHLVGLGHRCIAYFGGPEHTADSDHSLARHMGYVRALNDAGIPAPSSLTITQADWPAEVADTFVARAALYRAIDAGATAVVASCDVAAIGVIRMLMHRGLTVPGDVSVIGFDDTSLSRAWEPPLTTVRQDTSKASELALDMLIAAIETGCMPESRQIAAPLVVRGTTRNVRGYS